MKKIVALVLCLALALSLCTVAFAAYVTDDFGTGNDFTNPDKYTTVKMEKYYGGDETTDQLPRYNVTFTKKDSKGNIVNVWVQNFSQAADANAADYALVDDTNIIYLTNKGDYDDEATAVTTVKTSATFKCGDIFVKGNVGVYKDDAGLYYYSDNSGDKYLMADGKLVRAKLAGGDGKLEKKTLSPVSDSTFTATTGEVYKVVHTYAADVKKVNGTGTVTAVYCTKCNANFEFVVGDDTDAIAKFAGNYENTGLNLAASGVDDNVYVKTAATGTTTSGSSSTTVESAKTFDAGIALYAGMALASVAGSAVVIGKKKEF